MMPDSYGAKVRQDVELDALAARLTLGSGNSGEPFTVLAPDARAALIKNRPGRKLQKEIIAMRSDLVFGALSHVSNRYQLCQLASKATRKLHKPNTRLQDTTNEVLCRFQTTNPGSAAPVEAAEDQPVERRRAA
jgi:hypothetical protein